MKWAWAAAAILFVTLTPPLALAQPAQAPGATADVRTPDGQTLATAKFTQAPDAVLVSITFPNRTALVGTHAVQLHAAAQCTPGSALIAELSDLVIGPAGVSVYNLSTPSTVTLPMLVGGSLAIYAQGGDDPGQALACGAIQGQRAISDSRTAAVIGILGGLLVAGGVVLRRGA